MTQPAYDIVITYLAVHGGSYHKLIYFQEKLKAAGFSCRLNISCEAPLGLQIGVDVEPEVVEKLTRKDIWILKNEKIIKTINDTQAKLYLFDSSEIDLIGGLIERVKTIHNAKTGQFCSLIDDFCYWGADYAFLQHPLTLWFILKYRQRPDAKRLVAAEKILFTGNMLYEPVCNTWTSDIKTRSDLFSKYGFSGPYRRR